MNTTWDGLFCLCNSCTVRAPEFGRHQFFGTSEHYAKSHGSLLSGWMNYNYTACCWFPTSSNILVLPSQFWQIRFASCWLHCSKCRILVFLGYSYYNLHTVLITFEFAILSMWTFEKFLTAVSALGTRYERLWLAFPVAFVRPTTRPTNQYRLSYGPLMLWVGQQFQKQY